MLSLYYRALILMSFNALLSVLLSVILLAVLRIIWKLHQQNIAPDHR